MTTKHWELDAACLNSSLDFFDLMGPNKAKLREACSSCRVFDECLEYALFSLQSDGMWAGTTPGQREDILEARITGNPKQEVREV